MLELAVVEHTHKYVCVLEFAVMNVCVCVVCLSCVCVGVDMRDKCVYGCMFECAWYQNASAPVLECARLRVIAELNCASLVVCLQVNAQ